MTKYAVKNDDGTWQETYDRPSVFSSGLVCGPNAAVYEIEFSEVSKDDEWDFVGWRSKESGDSCDIDFAFPNVRQFDLCFGYGAKAEVDAGRGEIVYLKVIRERALGRAKDVSDDMMRQIEKKGDEPKYIMSPAPKLDDLMPNPTPKKQVVLEYLNGFDPISRAGGSFVDIKDGRRYPVNPSDCLEAFSDGEWCWDTEMIHYFDAYDAKLDDKFLEKFE